MKARGGDGAAIGGVILVVIAVIVVIFLLKAGVIHTGIPAPSARLSITPSSISVQSNQTSNPSNPITIHLTNVQNANDTSFNIVLNSSNSAQVYAVYFNQSKVNQITTPPLIGIEPYTSPPFQVFGKLPQGVTSSVTYNINVSLYYKQTLLDKKTIQVNVN